MVWPRARFSFGRSLASGVLASTVDARPCAVEGAIHGIDRTTNVDRGGARKSLRPSTPAPTNSKPERCASPLSRQFEAAGPDCRA